MDSNVSSTNRCINTRLGAARNSRWDPQSFPPEMSLVFRGFLGISLLSIILFSLPSYALSIKKRNRRSSRIIWRSTSSALAA